MQELSVVKYFFQRVNTQIQLNIKDHLQCLSTWGKEKERIIIPLNLCAVSESAVWRRSQNRILNYRISSMKQLVLLLLMSYVYVCMCNGLVWTVVERKKSEEFLSIFLPSRNLILFWKMSVPFTKKKKCCWPAKCHFMLTATLMYELFLYQLTLETFFSL